MESVLPARKHCSRCSRWRLRLDFRPRRRVSGECVSLASECDHCHRRGLRVGYVPVRALTRAERAARREEWRLWWWEKNRRDGVPEREFIRRQVDLGRDVMVDIGPFSVWLSSQVSAFGFSNVVSACRLDQREVWRYTRGEVSSVHLSIVDRCLVAFGGRSTDLYP